MNKKNIRYYRTIAAAGLVIISVLAIVHYLRLRPCKPTAPQELKLYKPGIKPDIVKLFPFSKEDALKEWEEKIFKNRVVYTIDQKTDLSYARARSDAAASALYYKVKLDTKTRQPVISWRLKVDKFPDKNMPESLEVKDENDFAARVYVIFPAKFFTNSKVLEYVWTKEVPAGTKGTSPYFKNIKMLALRKGPSDEWLSERRNIVEDYKNAFGKCPEYEVGAVAFMTNAEHTGTSAEAVYDDICVGYESAEERERG